MVNAHDLEDRLFAGLVMSTASRRPRGRGLPASIAAHLAVGALLALVPVFSPVELPPISHTYDRVVFAEPGPAAPPARGNARPARRPALATTPVAEPTPVTTSFELPLESPEPPTPTAGPDSQVSLGSGSPTGSDTSLGGAEGGREGGTSQGCVGCEGEGPVVDWDQPPRLLTQTQPVYPQEAFVKKIEGTVLLEVLIDASGRVADTRLRRSASPALDRAAEQTVRQWLFAPALRRGRPVALWAQTPVQFKIY